MGCRSHLSKLVLLIWCCICTQSAAKREVFLHPIEFKASSNNREHVEDAGRCLNEALEVTNLSYKSRNNIIKFEIIKNRVTHIVNNFNWW